MILLAWGYMKTAKLPYQYGLHWQPPSGEYGRFHFAPPQMHLPPTTTVLRPHNLHSKHMSMQYFLYAQSRLKFNLKDNMNSQYNYNEKTKIHRNTINSEIHKIIRTNYT